jgi:hypothetical protein
MLYYIAVFFIILFLVGSFIYTIEYLVLNNVFTSVQPQISFSEYGDMSHQLIFNTWNSLPVILIITLFIWLVTIYQRKYRHEA